MSHSFPFCAHYINIYHDIFLSHSHLSPVLSLPSRSNPFYEPRTSSPTHPPAGGPSLDMSSSQKRRAPPPPSSSPGLGPSPPAPKPSSIPDRERAQPVGPSLVAAVRELASSSPKVTTHTDTCDNKTKHVINASLKYSLCSVLHNNLPLKHETDVNCCLHSSKNKMQSGIVKIMVYS